MKTLAKNYKHGLKCTKRDVVIDCHYYVVIVTTSDYFIFHTKLEAINKLSELISLGYPKDVLHLFKSQLIKF